MKVKTENLIDLSLDWAVAECLGATRIQLYEYNGRRMIRVSLPEGIHAPWEPSRYWGQGGPIIDRMMQGKFFLLENDDSCCHVAYSETEHDNAHGYGPTPLIAAMRCFVANKFGDEVEVPEELMKISS